MENGYSIWHTSQTGLANGATMSVVHVKLSLPPPEALPNQGFLKVVHSAQAKSPLQ